MDKQELDKILDLHKKWLNDEEGGECANLQCANLRGADLDISCLPLWCGSLTVHFDEKQIKQFLYHTLSAAAYSKNVSEDLKKQLLNADLVSVANEFHRVGECPKLEVIDNVESN